MTISQRDQNYTDTTTDDIVKTAGELASEGYRLEQIFATSKDGVTDLIYSFDGGEGLRNYKMKVPENMEVPSISAVFWPAFIYENEIHDLFGVEFTDLKLDYKGNFFRVSSKTPWKTEKKEEVG
jgi:ech hydrogenase subunit D